MILPPPGNKKTWVEPVLVTITMLVTAIAGTVIVIDNPSATTLALMLDGLAILDLTDHRGEVGPWILAELGADVIKVEPPGGSPGRGEQPVHQGTSLQFAAYNSGKRSVVLDPSVAADRATLRELVAECAIVFDSGSPGAIAAYGVDRAKLEELNPKIIQVLVTAFGSDGPRAGDPASELTVAALGGPMSLQGTPDRAPVKVSIPQVWRHTGAEAAIAALVAKFRSDQTGEPQFVDVSAQAAMTWTMLNAMEASAVQGRDFERTGATLELAMSIPLRRSCVDGFVILVPRSQNGERLTPWLIEEGVVDSSWADEDWTDWDHRTIEGESTTVSHPELIEAMDELCSRYTKQELLDRGIELGVTIAPLFDAADLLAFEQLNQRSFWHQSADSLARVPGSFATVDGERLTDHRPSCELGAGEPRFMVSPKSESAGQGLPSSTEPPLHGLRVADFSWIGVGPITAKCLADHGATVVRVESASRIDGLRMQPPFKDGQPGMDRSNFFGSFNTSKQSMSIDLKNDEGLAVARRLVDWADVVIDSFTPGAMERLGLGPDEIRKTNPNVITVTTSLLGAGGQYSAMAGFGYHAAAIAGFFGLVGWPDLPPDGPWLAYTDTIGPRFITPTLLAAIDRKRRTGEGCHIEAAQLEIALQLLAPELADFQRTGSLPVRQGNRSADVAPQGVYRCLGDDQWIAISVEGDEAWSRFRGVLGDPTWAQGAILGSVEGRLAHHDALDTAIEAWTAERSPKEVESLLIEAGVAAGWVQRSSQLAEDPQYLHRNFYRSLEHSEVGAVTYAGHQYRIESYDHGPRAASPMLGEHTFEVLTDLLGMDVDEVAQVAASGALE